MDNNLVVATINDYPDAKYNRLFPCTMTQLSPLHKVMVNVVSIDPEKGKGDVYEQKEGLSLTKIACLKLMTAANVIMEESRPILPKACQRCVDIAQMTKIAPQCHACSSKEDVAYQTSILVPEPSGGYRRYIGTKEINKPQYKGLLEHMAAQCETKALLRALRAGLGIKGTYAKGELEKPFAVALVVLNTTDPELKAALIQRYAASESLLFSAPKAAQLGTGAIQSLPSGQQVNTITGEVIAGDLDDDEPPTTADAEVLTDDQIPPWMQQESENENIVTCQGCDCIIEPNGTWTVEKIVDYSKRNFGKILCVKCQGEARKRKGA